MDARWSNPFSAEATTEEEFFTPDGEEKVDMMHQKTYFRYAEKDGVQIICLPYAEGELEMWIALPEQGGMGELLEILANEGMFYLESDADHREVALSLPRFDLSDGNSLSGALKLLGVEAAFSENADFSGISDVPLCIDEVLQKVRVQVDEQGTKAVAATVIAMLALATRPEEESAVMNVNRPFVFVIADGETGSVCFAGVVENPLL